MAHEWKWQCSCGCGAAGISSDVPPDIHQCQCTKTVDVMAVPRDDLTFDNHPDLSTFGACHGIEK